MCIIIINTLPLTAFSAFRNRTKCVKKSGGVDARGVFRLNLPPSRKPYSNSVKDRTSCAARRSDIFCVKGFFGKSDENNKIAVSATLDGKLSWFKRKLLD